MAMPVLTHLVARTRDRRGPPGGPYPPGWRRHTDRGRRSGAKTVPAHAGSDVAGAMLERRRGELLEQQVPQSWGVVDVLELMPGPP